MFTEEFLESPYNRTEYLRALHNALPFREYIVPIPIDEYNQQILEFLEMGEIVLNDKHSTKLGVFEVVTNPDTRIERNRVFLRNLVADRLIKQARQEGAFCVYHDGTSQMWRLSFVSVEYDLIDGEITKKETSSRRFTYLLGKGIQVRTPHQRLSRLHQNSTLDDIKEAFSIEPLNVEFYGQLYAWYKRAEHSVTFPNDDNVENPNNINLIRLLTRLLFIWFLKEKELINPTLFDKASLQGIIKWELPSSYYKAVLQNLFFATLNREVTERSFRVSYEGNKRSGNYGVTNLYRYKDYFITQDEDEIMNLFRKTPFLNGGLFECLDRPANSTELTLYDADSSIRAERHMLRNDGFTDRADNVISVPNELFYNESESEPGLIDLLMQYQFTAEESTPIDVEVALDPELLGLVFENLLAVYNPDTQTTARKHTGSYYTPRDIVSYMVDESLKYYFTSSGISSEVTNSIFTGTEVSNLAMPNRKAVTKAVDNLKVLDPAVGSGAFPMGVLHRLVNILEQVDPQNQLWKLQQQERIKLTPDAESRESALSELEEVFSAENRYNAYSRKLYLLENCLYGVDVQPIAIHICKLRFFISLAIEQQPNTDALRNYGIKSLPNLETQFISANTLVDLQRSRNGIMHQLGLLDGVEYRERLHSVRQSWFNAKTRRTKDKCISEYESIREGMIANVKSNIELSHIDDKRLSEFDPFVHNVSCNWFNANWMFGVSGGFDIVLGNPPYIRQEAINSLQTKEQLKEMMNNDCNNGKNGKNSNHKVRDYKTYLLERYKDVFTNTSDIYTCFYGRGVELLKAGGVLCYITSNKWMRTRYGKVLREYIKTQVTIEQLLDLGGDQFVTTTVDTNILILSKQRPTTDYKFTAGSELPDEDTELWNMKVSDLSVDAYTLASPEVFDLKRHVEGVGTPLKSWDVSIYRGITTGYNEAFIVNTATKDNLISEDPKSAELLKRVVRGRDISRYRINWAGLWLIATIPVLKINIDDYPAIKKHLLSHDKKRLEQSGKRGSRAHTNNEWFEIQQSVAYSDEFTKPKIIYPVITSDRRFTYDKSGIYTNDKCFILTGESLEYLVGLLNSKLCMWYMQQVVAKLGKSGYEFRKIYMENLPIPQVSASEELPFIELSRRIASNKSVGKDTTNLESQMDELVYKLYGLSDAQRQVVESAFPTVESDALKPAEVEPKDAQAYISRASEFAKQGNYTDAIADYTNAIAIDSNNVNAYFVRGLAYKDVGDLAKAKEDFITAKASADDQNNMVFSQAIQYIIDTLNISKEQLYGR